MVPAFPPRGRRDRVSAAEDRWACDQLVADRWLGGRTLDHRLTLAQNETLHVQHPPDPRHDVEPNVRDVQDDEARAPSLPCLRPVTPHRWRARYLHPWLRAGKEDLQSWPRAERAPRCAAASPGSHAPRPSVGELYSVPPPPRELRRQHVRGRRFAHEDCAAVAPLCTADEGSLRHEVMRIAEGEGDEERWMIPSARAKRLSRVRVLLLRR